MLDPGMAFGTGMHPTTRLCLAAIEDYLIPGQRVVDLGCGSGILSIAAARLGASHVLALDIDSNAIQVARSNVHRNGLTKKIQIEISPLKDVEGMNPANLGMLVYGKPILAPCTALGVIELIKSTGVQLKGKEVVVVGEIDYFTLWSPQQYEAFRKEVEKSYLDDAESIESLRRRNNEGSSR